MASLELIPDPRSRGISRLIWSWYAVICVAQHFKVVAQAQALALVRALALYDRIQIHNI